MVYEYRCTSCKKRFDVIKSVRDIDINETCPKCGDFAERLFIPARVYFSGTKVENAEFNPAFGQVVKGKRHRQELAKRHGLIEIGNDYGSGEKHQKHFEDERAARKEARWLKED